MDFSRVTVEAADILPLPAENVLPCRFIRDKQVDDREGSPTRGRRIYRFFLDFGERLLEADTALCEKLFSCKGTTIFRTDLEVSIPPESLRITPRVPGAASETSLPGRVTEIYDYGRKTYARIAIATGRVTVIAPYDGKVGDAVHVIPDQSRLTVSDRTVGIVIA